MYRPPPWKRVIIVCAEKFEAILERQLPDEEKRRLADYVIATVRVQDTAAEFQTVPFCHAEGVASKPPTRSDVQIKDGRLWPGPIPRVAPQDLRQHCTVVLCIVLCH